MIMGNVGNILLSVIANGLHNRLESILEKNQIKKVVTELEKSSRSNAITSHGNIDFYNALDSYITKKNIVPFLIEICYNKNRPDFLTAIEFAEKEADMFITINKQYLGSRAEFIGIFQNLYNVIDSALNNLNESERKISNAGYSAIKESTLYLSSKIDKIPSSIELANSSSSSVRHYITLEAPPVNEEFSYRDDMVNKLYEEIKQNQKLALIYGLGGIGKTTVAKALYHKVKDEYKHIAWVEYQHNFKDSLLNSFKIFDEIEDAAARYRKIEGFLLDATNNTIIFIDNVSNIDSSGVGLIERLAANVVLTSRLNNIGNFKLFPVDFLSKEQCVEIFYKYYKYDEAREQEDAVRELVELAKCHTLLVELLARAARRPGYSLKEYAAELKAKGFGYADLSVKTSHTDTSQTIAKHLQALFEIVSVSDERKRILKNFSLMPSVEIPDDVKKWIDCNIDDISELTELGWLSASETGYEMHPIMKEAILLQNKEVQYEDFVAIISYMSGDEYIKDTDIYTQVHARLNIAESVMSHFCNAEKEEIGRLFNNIAGVYYRQGDYLRSHEWYHKALEIKEKVLGLNHPDTATTYNNIAGVHERQGDYLRALRWHHKALKICETVLGLEHPTTAISYNNIAYVYSNQGDYLEALEWFHKALRIFETMLGLDHPSTATTYDNIGLVYFYQGDHLRSLERYHKALEIREKVLGLDHPDTATTYNNIALVTQKQGDYLTSLKWYYKALEIFERVFDIAHPDTATTYNNIALVYEKQGDYLTSLKWHNKALEIREKVLGLEHPNTATSYNNIAVVHEQQGNYPKALEWYHKALAIYEMTLGLEHPYTIEVNEDILKIEYLLNF